ncbi:hypothetical protein [Methanosarcina sp.]|nr:hypothetical protein [Methanosarcina sp.]MDY9926168.1 hypothetical protein [Methanosarcina sp.]
MGENAFIELKNNGFVRAKNTRLLIDGIKNIIESALWGRKIRVTFTV